MLKLFTTTMTETYTRKIMEKEYKVEVDISLECTGTTDVGVTTDNIIKPYNNPYVQPATLGIVQACKKGEAV